MMQNILKNWKIQGELIQIYRTAWSVDDEYVLKVYDNLDSLKRNEKILKTLYEMGIPVAEIVNLENGQGYCGDGTKYYMLTKKLRGNNIVDIKNNLGMAYKMGEVLAQLHMAFLKCEDDLGYWDNSLLKEMKGWIRKNLSESGWALIKEEEFDLVVNQLEEVYDVLPKQLIHRDVNFGNFLFDQGEFSGYIDFDLSQRNIRIFDLSYFLIGLLSVELDNKINMEEWIKIVTDVIVGYESQTKLLRVEKESIPCVMKCIELLFVAYFSGIDNKECAMDAVRLYELVCEKEEEILGGVFHNI
ncbi:phosphotransferase [Anaeromicropila herbilytica]|uniref:Aminoglycoside phosphotransferase domain-containing protein n=1 Tax=Anaeromicropila herbilytica TaxID=2785025 RepID=A0A7R7EHM6_9FIRM|nr:phosphotransferase [Anaeromicropila herbilytica]BCN28905.1 hypothetical protein bsdtb5_02000 [Anaeromicropila herbilytica]